MPETPIFLDDQELNGGIDTLGTAFKPLVDKKSGSILEVQK